jgi:hypothetical protein
MKLGTGPSRDQSREEGEPRKGDAYRDLGLPSSAVAVDQPGAIRRRRCLSTSSRHGSAPAGGQLPGGSQGGGVRRRLGPGDGHGAGGQAAQSEGERPGQGGTGHQQDGGRTLLACSHLSDSPGPPLGHLWPGVPSALGHLSTRITARAESSGSGSSRPTMGTSVVPR